MKIRRPGETSGLPEILAFGSNASKSMETDGSKATLSRLKLEVSHFICTHLNLNFNSLPFPGRRSILYVSLSLGLNFESFFWWCVYLGL
jgi:hypothetical protein